jgi:Flp pilus assembly pilin Flp
MAIKLGVSIISKMRLGAAEVKRAYLGLVEVFNAFLKLLDEYSGAAAAYSLKSLSTAYTGDVVEVRRSSDNSTSSFTAAEVADGTMLNWVNTAAPLPLDLTTNSASAAYSLRNLSSTYTGNVVEVRRSSDNSSGSFTAAEVADGTMLNWVGASGAVLPLDTDSSASVAYSLRNLSSTYTGNVVEVRRSSDNSSGSFTAAEVTDGTMLNWVGTTANDFAFVETLYDQSGNNNNATQSNTVFQPLIVEGGALIIEGGAPTIKYDGIDDVLNFNAVTGNNYSVFSKYYTLNINARLFRNLGGNTTSGGRRSNNNIYFQFDGITYDQGIAHPNLPFVANYQVIGSAMTIRSNGSTIFNQSVPAGTNSNISRLGQFVGGSGTIAEFIIYTTDQSANYSDIESNIGSHYGISVAGGGGNDGFVETWYDQSGNSNNAVQATQSAQPQIVKNGVQIFDSDGKPTLDFGGSESLDLTTTIAATTGTLFTVANLSTSRSNHTIIGGYNTAFPYARENSTSTAIWAASGTPNAVSNAYLDGVLQSWTDRGDIYGAMVTDNQVLMTLEGVSTSDIEEIGRMTSSTVIIEGTISEVIIYDTDESADRPLFEQSIGQYYDIQVPVVPLPPVNADAFVSTWYDQSGNSNNAVQATQSAQPQIVSNGALILDAESQPTIQYAGGQDLEILNSIPLTSGAVFTVGELDTTTVTTNTNSPWTQVGSDIDGESANDHSGHRVSTNAAGNIVAIGAIYNAETGTQAGHVRVYENLNGVWTQIGQDIDGEAAGDQSGISVSINSAGDIVAIGAHQNDGSGTNSGHVRVFKNISGVWTQIGSDIDGKTADDLFGFSVSINAAGNIVAIGGYYNEGILAGNQWGHVQVYENISGVWTQIGADIYGEAAGDESGYSVSINAAGDIVAIGAHWNDGANGAFSGHVRVYENISGVWTQIGQDIDGEAIGDQSSISVSINAAGDIVAIGAHLNDGNGSASGHVRVYENLSGVWTQIGADIDGEAAGDYSGVSVSINAAGNIVAIGAHQNDGSGTNSGHVRVFKNISGVWTQIGSDIDGEATGDRSGWAVSLNSAGDIVAIGAYANDGINGTDSGHVRVYTKTVTSSPSQFILGGTGVVIPHAIQSSASTDIWGTSGSASSAYVGGALQSWNNSGDVYDGMVPGRKLLSVEGMNTGAGSIESIASAPGISDKMKGNLSDVVIYTADQSSNRIGIEDYFISSTGTGFPYTFPLTLD